MKYLLIILTVLTISGTCFAMNSDPNELPYYEYDPNEVVIDANSVTFTIEITVSREQFRAMRQTKWTVIKMFKTSTYDRLWLKMVERARAIMSKRYTIEQLEEMAGE